MKEFRLHLRDKYGHPDVVVWMNENMRSGADWILGFFESAVLGGGKFQHDETVQIGWMIVTLRGNSKGDLEVWEPDGVAIPVRWVRGANATFRDLTIQKEICALFSVEPNYPSMRQFGVASREGFEASTEFTMRREREEGNDTGWRFMGPAESTPTSTFHSLYEISAWHRDVVPFLALPTGSIVERDKRGVLLTLGSRSISDEESALLADILKSRTFG